MGLVKERCNRWLKMLFGGIPVIQPLLNVDLEVRDSEADPVLFTVRVPGIRFKFNLLALLGIKERRVEVVAADGELIGSFVMKLLTLTPSCHVYDGHDEKIADFKFKTLELKNGLTARMVMQSMDGKQWGTVTGTQQIDLTKKINAGKKVIVTGGFLPKEPDLVISVDPGAADQAATKLLLMAAGVAMRLFNLHTIFDDTKRV
ncbi:MAG: hypothetical protein JWO38_5239 [Gemmataceae bacterium]|nr:hypothetical protein [Gemmataceae bacterium]